MGNIPDKMLNNLSNAFKFSSNIKGIAYNPSKL